MTTLPDLGLAPFPADVAPAPLELRSAEHLLPGDPASLRGADRVRARAALVARLREDGYLVLRGWVPPDDVAALRDRVTAELEDLGVVEPASEPGDARRTRLPAVGFHHERYLEVVRRLLSLEQLHRFAYHRRLVDLVALLEDEDEVIVHPRKVIRMCHAHEHDRMSTTGVHQDFTYVQGDVDGLTIWVPLTDAPRERGALAVLVGSATDGVRPVVDASGPCGSGPTVPRADDPERWGSTDFAAGDVLVMHGFTVHRGLPNLTDRTRLSLDLRFRGASQPISFPEMLPPNYPDIGEWSDLAAGWSSLEGLRVPPGIRVVGTKRVGAGLTAPPSPLLGTPETHLPPL